MLLYSVFGYGCYLFLKRENERFGWMNIWYIEIENQGCINGQTSAWIDGARVNTCNY